MEWDQPPARWRTVGGRATPATRKARLAAGRAGESACCLVRPPQPRGLPAGQHHHASTSSDSGPPCGARRGRPHFHVGAAGTPTTAVAYLVAFRCVTCQLCQLSRAERCKPGTIYPTHRRTDLRSLVLCHARLAKITQTRSGTERSHDVNRRPILTPDRRARLTRCW